MSIRKEPTLPLDYDVLSRNVGFRSPLLVAAKLWLMGVAGMVQRLEISSSHPPIVAYGWWRRGAYYITRVNAGHQA